MSQSSDHKDRALASIDFGRLLEGCGVDIDGLSGLAIACSGGPDSMALSILTAQWAAPRKLPIHGLAVDHRLRDESEAEAQLTCDQLERLGIAATLLTREGPRPRSNIQMAARDARYRLMRDWCHRKGVPYLLTAHHLEDQAETFLFRLARGSGVDGLSAMDCSVDLGGVTLLRPCLSIPGEQLRALLSDYDVKTIQDPSNLDAKFSRVRFRALSARLAAEGLTPRRLAGTANRMRRAREALDCAVDQALVRYTEWSDAGYVWLDPRFAKSCPEEINLRLLSRVLTRVSGAVYPPRLEKLERLLSTINQGVLLGGRTCGGCRVIPKKERILVCREINAIDRTPRHLDQTGSEPLVWDGRFVVLAGEGPREQQKTEMTDELCVAPLGEAGWRAALDRKPELRRRCDIPAPARRALPAIWADGSLCAVPHLGIDCDIVISARFQISAPAFSSRAGDTI